MSVIWLQWSGDISSRVRNVYFSHVKAFTNAVIGETARRMDAYAGEVQAMVRDVTNHSHPPTLMSELSIRSTILTLKPAPKTWISQPPKPMPCRATLLLVFSTALGPCLLNLGNRPKPASSTAISATFTRISNTPRKTSRTSKNGLSVTLKLPGTHSAHALWPLGREIVL